jgi:hypothetical protein
MKAALLILAMKFLSVPVLLLGSSLSAYGGGVDTSCNRLLKEKRFVFRAQWASPYRGGERRQLVPSYDLIVKQDALNVYLPYYGRMYTVPTPEELRFMSIHFTSRSFGYTLEAGRRGAHYLTIKPKDQPNVQSLSFTVSDACSCSLWIYSSGRDPILYEGLIEELRE